MMAVKEHNLSNDEVIRYSRQILVQEFGVQGQERLRATSLLIVGAGGLGCPVALYCAGAGIGRIGIVDGDFISSDNLHRQIAYDEHSLGQSKAESIKSSIERLNSNVLIDVYKNYLFKYDALQIISNYDIVADCTDNVSTSYVLFLISNLETTLAVLNKMFMTSSELYKLQSSFLIVFRYLVNDACVLANKPLVSGSVVRWDGQLSVYNYGKDSPCYRCIFPDPSPADTVTNCSDNGVLGPVVGVIGSMQANEIIKIAAIKKLCGKNATITELGDCKELYGCSIRIRNKLLAKSDRIDPYFYFKLSENSDKKPLLLDTRPPHEFSIGHLPNAINIPMVRLCLSNSVEIMRELGTNINEIRDKGIYVICRRGEDSQIAVLYLRKEFADSLISIKDIDGGYEKWYHAVDKDFPIY
ncbi:ThiF family protein [Acanthocheilonema viteae]